MFTTIPSNDTKLLKQFTINHGHMPCKIECYADRYNCLVSAAAPPSNRGTGCVNTTITNFYQKIKVGLFLQTCYV